MNKLVQTYNKFKRLPFGDVLFSKAMCFAVPYNKSISPVITRLEPGLVEVNVKNKRKVRNHIKTVHAIAMCNMCELAAGFVMETSIPSQFRWIPKDMQVKYLKMAKTDLTVFLRLENVDWQDSMDLPLKIEVKNEYGNIVLRAVITMYITQKNRGYDEL